MAERSAMYYRVTSNNIGVYQTFKKMANQKEWHEILNSSKWLPKPPKYKIEYKSYFTERGFKKFMLTVFPIVKKLIDDIQIKQFENISGEIIYADKYQLVISA